MDNRNDTLKKNNKGYRRKPIALIVRYSSPTVIMQLFITACGRLEFIITSSCHTS